MADEVITHDTLMDVALRALGDFAGDKWTDFNIHDPGVTIIEYLAYAIHDLSFRTNLPTADLVASVLGDGGIRYFLPSPSHCLEAPIVTDSDIRALILDLHFVRNVWVEARDDGVKDIVLDVSAELGAQQRRWLRQAVREVIVRHRMIGADVGSICFLEREPIEVDLILEISHDMRELDLYLTRLLSEIDTHIMMLPRRQSNNGVGSAQFGPKLAHGDFNAQSLLSSVRQDRLDLSALIELIENADFIEGEKNRTYVRQLNACRLMTRGGAGEQVFDSHKIKSDFSGLSLDPNCAYELDLDAIQLTLQKDGVLISPDLSSITATVRQIRDAKALDKKLLDIQVPDSGEARADVASYRSTQTEFPALYTLKKGQLTKAASRAQRAQAKQLQGFILLLEQFIANAMVRVQESAALIGLMDIKCLSPGMVEGIEFHAGMEESHTTLREWAGALLEQDTQTRKMTNKWSQSAASLFGQADDFDDIYSLNQTILERFRGWNYQVCPEGDRSLLWLETYLHKYLRSPDLEASRTGDLSKVKIDILPHELNGRNQYQFQLALKGNDSALIGQDIYRSAEMAEKAGADALSIAASRHRHHVSRDLRGGSEQKYIYELLDTRGDVLARSSQTYDHTAALERDIQAWVKVGKYARSRRQVFVIEHILLRPANEMAVGTLPDACVNQISVILPSDERHWQKNINSNQVIFDLENRLPAHILLNTLWLDDDEIDEFEGVYCAWIDDYWGGGPSLGQTRRSLIALLERHGLSGWSQTGDSSGHFENIGGVYDD